MKVNPDRARRYICRTQPRRMEFDMLSLSAAESAERDYERWASKVRLVHPDAEFVTWDDYSKPGMPKVIEWRPRRR